MGERREMRGRPLRALAIILGGWIAMRTALLWPDAVTPLRKMAERVATVARPVAPADADPMPATPARAKAGSVALPLGRAPLETSAPLPAAVVTRSAPTPSPSAPPEPVLALAGMVRYGNAEPASRGPSRWSRSGWAILRGSGAAAGVATPQLGGSQAGGRIAYALGDDRRFAIALRVASAIGARQQEAAIGLEWRPTRLPIRLVAEQRIGIAGVRGGSGVGIVGGASAVRLPLAFRLDGYAQAGAIARDGGEGYADGSFRVARPVAGGIDLGLGAWGAAQKGAHRLDVGPSASVAVPLGGRRVRVTLDWRHRVAGDARPESGLALSLGSDF